MKISTIKMQDLCLFLNKIGIHKALVPTEYMTCQFDDWYTVLLNVINIGRSDSTLKKYCCYNREALTISLVILLAFVTYIFRISL